MAAGRILHVLNADAHVIVVSPKAGLCKEVAWRIQEKQVEWRDRGFLVEDLSDDVNMVLTAIDDPSLSSEIYKLCKSKKIPVNAADIPPECDFYFGSEIRNGPLQIMVSTNGKGPKLASLIRKKIESSINPATGMALEKTGLLRQKLRDIVPEPENSRKRMRWMIEICELWSLEELAMLDENLINRLLGYFPKKTPSYREITTPAYSKIDNYIWFGAIIISGAVLLKHVSKAR